MDMSDFNLTPNGSPDSHSPIDSSTVVSDSEEDGLRGERREGGEREEDGGKEY